MAYPIDDHLLNSIINQIALDVDTIWNQREQFIFSGSTPDGSGYQALQVGDWLATDAMESFGNTLDKTAHAFPI